ncbi:MAG: BON domain-containing protein [Pseudomonadota bacterium]
MTQLHRASVVFLGLLMAVMLGCSASDTQRSTGEYVDDASITTRVKTAIFQEPSLKTLEISVETFRGVVQLSGFVSTRDEIEKAGEVASGVEGVRSVQNDLRLR